MKFEKISIEQYNKDFEMAKVERKFNDTSAEYEDILVEVTSYTDLKLPTRATKGSAGYDIYAIKEIVLLPGQEVLLPTGVKVQLDDDKYLQIVPRSGLGFKYGLELKNTVGIIDSDYYNNPKNEGHIWVKLVYPKMNSYMDMEPLHIRRGEAICQGIICQYFMVENDYSASERVGGFGSTSD